MVSHKEGIEFSNFQQLSESFYMTEVEIGVRIGPRVTPGTRMDADGSHEGAKTKLARCLRRGSDHKLLVNW